jgi:hypothetical protein
MTTISCFYLHFAETGEIWAECVPELGAEGRYLDGKGGRDRRMEKTA